MRLHLFRWRLIVGAAAAVLAAGTSAPFGRAPAAAQAALPNVLVIVTDDQRAAGTLRVMPATREWLETRGTRFLNAYATTPTCCPSRASIFTGMYAHNHGVQNTEHGEADKLDQSQTVQRALHDLGYRTAVFGKYLNGWDISTPPPHFDKWGIFSGEREWYYRNGIWNVNGEVRSLPTYSTTFVRRKARRFIREGESADPQPWLMFVTPTAPHAPYTPARRDRKRDVPRFRPGAATFEQDRSDKPPFVQRRDASLEEIRWMRRGQLRTLLSVDRMIGSLRDLLQDTGELRDTLVIFASDNGFLWGEHGLYGKSLAYEPAVRIPMIASWPGTIAEGTKDHRLVANIDITPTIYEAIGSAPPDYVDGRSLLDDFSRERLLLENWERDDGRRVDWIAHRTLDYKYIESYSGDHTVLEWTEHYDYATDPWELENLIEQGDSTTHPDAQLRADFSCSGTQGPTACP